MKSFLIASSALAVVSVLSPAEAQTREELLLRLPENAVYRNLVHQKGVRNPALKRLRRVAGNDGVLTRAEVDQRKADWIASRIERKRAVIADMDFDGDRALLEGDVEKLRQHPDSAYGNQLDLMLAQGADTDGDDQLTAEELEEWLQRTASRDKTADEMAGTDLLATFDLDGDHRIDAAEIDEFYRILWDGYHGTSEAPLCDLPVFESDRLVVYSIDGRDSVTIQLRHTGRKTVVTILTDRLKNLIVESDEQSNFVVIAPEEVQTVTGVDRRDVIRVADTECLKPPAATDGMRGLDVRRGQIAFATGVTDAEPVVQFD